MTSRPIVARLGALVLATTLGFATVAECASRAPAAPACHRSHHPCGTARIEACCSTPLRGTTVPDRSGGWAGRSPLLPVVLPASVRMPSAILPDSRQRLERIGLGRAYWPDDLLAFLSTYLI